MMIIIILDVHNRYMYVHVYTYLDHRLQMNTIEHTGWSPSLQLHRCIFVLGYENNNK